VWLLVSAWRPGAGRIPDGRMDRGQGTGVYMYTVSLAGPGVGISPIMKFSLSTILMALSSLPFAPAPPSPCCWSLPPTLVGQRESG
jgi:hypothetical protein